MWNLNANALAVNIKTSKAMIKAATLHIEMQRNVNLNAFQEPNLTLDLYNIFSQQCFQIFNVNIHFIDNGLLRLPFGNPLAY